MKAVSITTYAALIAVAASLAVSCNREEHRAHEGAEKQKEHAKQNGAPHAPAEAPQNPQAKPDAPQH